MICLKIIIFALSKTTIKNNAKDIIGCDLLENYYLCIIKNNFLLIIRFFNKVVICLKIIIFALSKTTNDKEKKSLRSCDLLENYYLCIIKNNSLQLTNMSSLL